MSGILELNITKMRVGVINNKAWVLTKKISSILWNYFIPNHPFSPDSGMDKYLEF